jgi:hypothetical protein
VRRRLPSPSSESGLISVGAVIAVALGLVFVFILLAAFQDDPEKFGSVRIPSKSQPIELSGGQIDVSYAQQVAVGTEDELQVPSDLSYSIVDANGEAVPVEVRAEDPKDTDLGAMRLVGQASVPEDGTYYVTSEVPSAGRAAPVLAFGLSPVGAVRERAEDVLDALKGPAGAIVILVLLILYFVNRADENRRRPPREGDYYHQPPPG